MENNPLISVIVPIYNVEQYIHETLGCIINQTYDNWECILIDDGYLIIHLLYVMNMQRKIVAFE